MNRVGRAPMSDIVLARIAAWEAAGLIDSATAERLRAAEANEPGDAMSAVSPARTVGASSFFGPSVSLAEAFSYLGVAFVLAAWVALIARLSSEASTAAR